MTSSISPSQSGIASERLRCAAQPFIGGARRLSQRILSSHRDVWQGALVTPVVLAFKWLPRRLRSRVVGYRFIARIEPSDGAAEESGELLPAGAAVAADPTIKGAVSASATAPCVAPSFGAASWRLHRDAVLPVGSTARRTAWLNEETLFVEHTELDVFHFSNYSAHLDLVVASRSGAVARKHEPETFLDVVIYPGSFAPGNWYHWLTETLPRIWLAERLPEKFADAPLLIHSGFLDVPAMRETLDLVRGDRPICTVHGAEWIHVERLVWIDGMFTMNHHAIYPDGFIDQTSRFHPAMRDFRAMLLDQLTSPGSGTPPRVFLDRGASARRYNDAEVKEALISRGFVVVEPGSLDFAGQLRLFAGARVLVGPSGAAWANLLFASGGTKALYWVPEDFEGTQIWSSIGALSGVATHEHTYPQEPKTFKTGSYRIDVDALLEHLDRVLESDV